MSARFEIRRTRRLRQQWHVVLIAANGETLSTSEKLSSEHAARVNIEAQRTAITHADVSDVFDA